MSGWIEALEAYVAHRLPAADRVQLRPAAPMPAGASNATVPLDMCAVCDGTEVVVPLILRPQRQGGILAPYDVQRQFTIMRALSRTRVPVPPVLWFEPGSETVGVPFFFMARLSGVRTPPLFWYQPGPMVDAAAAALATLHAVDWRSCGLGELLPPGCSSPLAAEMAAWAPRAALTGADSDPTLARLAEVLIANEPSDARFAMTHGDTNAGNYLFRGNEVAAVVDWELGAIGDPPLGSRLLRGAGVDVRRCRRLGWAVASLRGLRARHGPIARLAPVLRSLGALSHARDLRRRGVEPLRH